MAIQVNPLNIAPLAALAGNNTPNLGLQPYGLDVGAPMQGYVQGILKAIDMKEKEALLKNNLEVQQLSNQGRLSETELSNQWGQQRDVIKEQFANIRNEATNKIQQQIADQTGQFQQGQLVHSQNQLQQEGQLKQQELAQQKDYQQGMVGLGNRNASTDEKRLQTETYFKQMEQIAVQNEHKQNQQGTMYGLLYQGGGIKDDAKRVQFVNTIADRMKEMGATDAEVGKIKQMNPMQLQVYGASGMNMVSNAQQMKSQLGAKGIGLTVDENGDIIQGNMGGNPYDAKDATQGSTAFAKAAEVGQKMTVMQSSLTDAQKQVADLPEGFTGPITGLWNKYTKPQAQILESTLNSITLQAKDLYNLGSGQGFSDADREFLKEISGGLKNYKGSLGAILEHMQKLTSQVSNNSWLTQNDFIQNTSPKRYEQWKAQNPEPSVNVQAFDNGKLVGDIKPVPITKLKEANKRGWQRV